MLKKYPGIIEILLGSFITMISTIIIILGAIEKNNTVILAACILYISAPLLVIIGGVRLYLNYKKKSKNV